MLCSSFLNTVYLLDVCAYQILEALFNSSENLGNNISCKLFRTSPVLHDLHFLGVKALQLIEWFVDVLGTLTLPSQYHAGACCSKLGSML